MHGSIEVNDVHSVHRATEISDHFYASAKGINRLSTTMACSVTRGFCFRSCVMAAWLTLTAILDFSDSKSAHS